MRSAPTSAGDFLEGRSSSLLGLMVGASLVSTLQLHCSLNLHELCGRKAPGPVSVPAHLGIEPLWQPSGNFAAVSTFRVVWQLGLGTSQRTRAVGH